MKGGTTIISISLLRVLAMIFIVFYHCICFYGIWHFDEAPRYENIEAWRDACNVALQLFMFISGYLYATNLIKRKRYVSVQGFLRGKVQRILVPYIFWALLMIVVLQDPFINILYGESHLWFLLTLFITFIVFTPPIYWIFCCKLKFWQDISILLSIFIIKELANHLLPNDVPNVLSFKQILTFSPAFYWGIICVKHDLWDKVKKLNNAKYFIILCGALLLLIYFNSRQVLYLSSLYVWIPTYCLLLFLLDLFQNRLSLRLQDGECRMLQTLDKNSLGIYILHHCLIWVVLLYVPGVKTLMCCYQYVAPFILFILVFMASFALAYFMNNNHYTAQLIGLKRNK